MGYAAGSRLLYMPGHGYGLYHSLGADTERVGGILQYISEDEIFDTAVVVFFRYVYAFEGGNAQALCPAGYLIDLLLAEPARIDGEGMYLQSFYFL